MRVINDLKLPIALTPYITYNNNLIHGETIRLQTSITNGQSILYDININNESPLMFYDILKKEMKSIINNGLNTDIPYKIGIYSASLTPIITSPIDFTPIIGIMLRIFKYEI